MPQLIINPIIALVKQIIQPDKLVVGQAYESPGMEVKWLDHSTPDKNIALWLYENRLFVLQNLRRGAIPHNSEEIPIKYTKSWVITTRDDNWRRSFREKASINLEYLIINNTVINEKTVRDFIEAMSPFKEFNQINYIPKLLKEHNGTYLKQWCYWLKNSFNVI